MECASNTEIAMTKTKNDETKNANACRCAAGERCTCAAVCACKQCACGKQCGK